MNTSQNNRYDILSFVFGLMLLHFYMKQSMVDKKIEGKEAQEL